MDPRQSLLDLLESFVPYDSQENESSKKVKDFVLTHPDCFGHSVLPGHVTGSAFVVDRDLEYTLLTHHKKMNMWLQFGGHSDDHPNVVETAMREAREESGLDDIRLSILGNSIFDIDVHTIPAGGQMPDHIHYDVRFLLIANKADQCTASTESNELAWIRLEDAADYNARPEFLRMVEKVMRLRNSGILSSTHDHKP
ncbi:MAG: NUDIX hydrolase [Candidatus Gottesmanbacteria bacterium]|nr:NUDIX hydrolase [Candidatus Gottesmanbacteria bacterium]